ncbi:MAG TPA: DMT family transporter [Thermomicrobiaceae bacterium]|nr:DMT family transporter [Thermomicrobiaceae bacterium]
MSPLALALILVAAVIHASWNLLVKRVDGGPAFVWLFGTVSAVIYAPLAVAAFLLARPHLGATQWAFMLGSGTLQIVYFLLLQRGYRVGDLSVVYPLARGTGPLLATVGAIALLGERPGPVALFGAALIIGGVFALTGGPRLFRDPSAHRGAIFGVLVGVVIATYTLWDAHAVSALAIPPLVLNWAQEICLALALAPLAAGQRDAVRHLWARHRGSTLAVGALSPLAYILVLTALRFTPVSYVAPAREISILIGTFMGARLLSEGELKRRLPAAGVMVVGILVLAFG